jgi:hypothetical protein
MPNPEIVRRLAAGRYAGVVVLGVLVAAAFGAGIALAQPKQAPNRPSTAPSPATQPAPEGAVAVPTPAGWTDTDDATPPAAAEHTARTKPTDDAPRRAVKGHPPYVPAQPADGAAAPTTTGRPPASPPPSLTPSPDPADK